MANRSVGIVQLRGSFLKTSLRSAILPGSIGLKSARRRYQSLWISEEHWRWFTLSKWTFKTCPDGPNEFRIPSCKQESRPIVPFRTRNSYGLLFSLRVWSIPDLPDRVPSSGVGAVCQFHKEQCQHFAFSILFCLIQTALQITVWAACSPWLAWSAFLLGSHEYFFVRTEFFPIPFENPAHLSKSRFLFTFRTDSRSLNAVQHLSWMSPRLNVSEKKRHHMGQHSLRTPERTVVKSTVQRLKYRTPHFVSRLHLLQK